MKEADLRCLSATDLASAVLSELSSSGTFSKKRQEELEAPYEDVGLSTSKSKLLPPVRG